MNEKKIDLQRRVITKAAWATPIITSITLPTHAQTSATTAAPATTPCTTPTLTISSAVTFSCNTGRTEQQLDYFIDDTDKCNPLINQMAGGIDGDIQIQIFHITGAGSVIRINNPTTTIQIASTAYQEDSCMTAGTVTGRGGRISMTVTASPNSTQFQVSGSLIATDNEVSLSDLVLSPI